VIRGSVCPESWTRAALSPPRAHGVPLPLADFKSRPDDFRVDEELSFAPSGAGAHWLLRVEKTAANTRWVAAQLARLAGVADHDVGYAGLKDRQAVTTQWFSVPAGAEGAGSRAFAAGASVSDFWRNLDTADFRVLEVHGNARKLQRGALSGNRFRIRLHNVAWSREQLAEKLEPIRLRGVPNYFGPQRFGSGGRNLERAAAWAASGQAPRGRSERGFALSAARSLLFNAALSRRVAAGDWSELAVGDIASLDGSGSHFRINEMDETLRSRLASFDIHPSGPLWGRGAPATQGGALAYETAAAQECGDLAGLLESAGLEQDRRALRCVVRDLAIEFDAATVTLSFMLGRGQFATAVLREICDLRSAAELESDEES
jgi:tRNA pseudouridine13 synthase